MPKSSYIHSQNHQSHIKTCQKVEHGNRTIHHNVQNKITIKCRLININNILNKNRRTASIATF